MKVLSVPYRSLWLRVATPAGLLLFIPLLISPTVSATGDAVYPIERKLPSAVESRLAESTAAPAEPYSAQRSKMVREQIEARGIHDTRVLDAMQRVARHRFVPPSRVADAYRDRPLPIGFGQTISQPYIVAAMSELAKLEPGSKVLEVGTGSGYQAAVIHEITGEVFSLEIIAELAESARHTLTELGYSKAQVRHANGYLGWPEEAPFDAILVTAAPPEVPSALLEQLKQGGRLIVPVGTGSQVLEVHTRTRDGFASETVFRVRFVPMVERARSGTGVGSVARD